MNRFGMKAALVLATMVISLTMFATAAFAAPQLDAGETSGGPHDSRGNCASCHDYPDAEPAADPAPTTTTPDVATPGTSTGTSTATPGSVTITIGGVTIVISSPTASTQPGQVVNPAPSTSTPTSADQDDGDDDDDEDEDDD